MSKTYYAYQKSDDDKHAKLVSFGSGADGEQNLINLGVPNAEPQTQNIKKILRNKNFPLLNNNRIYELCFSDDVDDKTRITQDITDNTKGFLNCDRWNTGDGAYCKNSDDEAVKMFYQFELIFDDSLTEEQKDAIVTAQLNGTATNGTNKVNESNTLTINGKENESDEELTSTTFSLYYKKHNGKRYLFTKTSNLARFSSISSMIFNTKLYTILNDVSITEIIIRGYEDNNTCIADPSTAPAINWAYVPCVIKVNNNNLATIFQDTYCFSVGDSNELILHKTFIDFGADVNAQLLLDEYDNPISHIDLTYVLCDNYN